MGSFACETGFEEQPPKVPEVCGEILHFQFLFTYKELSVFSYAPNHSSSFLLWTHWLANSSAEGHFGAHPLGKEFY